MSDLSPRKGSRSGGAGRVLLVLALLAAFILISVRKEETRDQSVLEAFQVLKARDFVDLTHAFDSDIPHWPGFPPSERVVLYSHEEDEGTLGTGFFAEQFTHVGQWGTHVDAPIHFAPGGRTLDEIPVSEMFLPLVLIDVHTQVAANPDYTITLNDVHQWEMKYGSIPNGAFVVMRSDWSNRWPDQDAMRNLDEEGTAHYPGWSREVLEFLINQRRITAIGHETLDTDPGIATSQNDYSLETYLLSNDRYQIELLNNLDQLPEFGAVAVVAFPKPKAGSGFPARVFAIVP
jgi:kynurenine formamidase